MDLAAEPVDLYCLVEVAGLAVPLQLAKEVVLVDVQRSVEEAGWATPNALWRGLDWLAS
jgi:hypothetical protein